MIYRMKFSSSIKGFESATCFFKSDVLNVDEVSTYVFSLIADLCIPYDAGLGFDSIEVVDEYPQNFMSPSEYLKMLKKKYYAIKTDHRRDVLKLTGHPIKAFFVQFKKN